MSGFEVQLTITAVLKVIAAVQNQLQQGEKGFKELMSLMGCLEFLKGFLSKEDIHVHIDAKLNKELLDIEKEIDSLLQVMRGRTKMAKFLKGSKDLNDAEALAKKVSCLNFILNTNITALNYSQLAKLKSGVGHMRRNEEKILEMGNETLAETKAARQLMQQFLERQEHCLEQLQVQQELQAKQQQFLEMQEQLRLQQEEKMAQLQADQRDMQEQFKKEHCGHFVDKHFQAEHRDISEQPNHHGGHFVHRLQNKVKRVVRNVTAPIMMCGAPDHSVDDNSAEWVMVRGDHSDDNSSQIACHGCGVSPILGLRFNCLDCVNFDLCGACHAGFFRCTGPGAAHNEDHSFACISPREAAVSHVQV
jgi:hypothetical protein